MSINITMPRLSDTMEVGTIIKWNVKEGEKVSAGDVVADVETDKATMEMQVYDDGTIAKILVDEGQQVEVGRTIAVLAEAGEKVSETKENAAPSRSSASTAVDVKADTPKGKEKKSASRQAEPAKENGEKEPELELPDDDAAQRASATTEQQREPRPARRVANEAAPATTPRKDAASDGRIRVSPLARNLAEDHGIDLRSIGGSGPGGRIIKRDVMAAIDAGEETKAAVPPAAKRREPSELATTVRMPDAAPPATTRRSAYGPIQSRRIALSNMRQVIARRLIESKTTIPHYQVTVRLNMDPLLAMREDLNGQLEDQGVKLSVNDFLVRGCALAMHQHPMLNSSWGEDHVEVHGEVNIGIAIALPEERGGGLVVGTIRSADMLALRDVSAESRRLAEKARDKGLTLDEMSDSTITISNLGMFGVDDFTAIINPPNCAILAVGSAQELPVVRDGQIVVGREMAITASFDHRIIDGATGAKFLQTLKQLIEHPATLLV
jgi:pyruvate dehydrogenase E2 component (dihydrolipoamide acetyltransferase)